MSDGTTVIHGGMVKAKGFLLEWGVPIVGLVVGVMIGDAVKAGAFFNDLLPIKLGEKAMGIIVAGMYAVVGALVWSWAGTIGKFVGSLLFGMSIGTVYLALTGKALVIPGFSGMVA